MRGLPVASNEIPRMLHLYLACSPRLDLEYRCLPRSGGLLEQDYETMVWFGLIESRVKEIIVRQSKETEAKIKQNRNKTRR